LWPLGCIPLESKARSLWWEDAPEGPVPQKATAQSGAAQ